MTSTEQPSDKKVRAASEHQPPSHRTETGSTPINASQNSLNSVTFSFNSKLMLVKLAQLVQLVIPK